MTAEKISSQMTPAQRALFEVMGNIDVLEKETASTADREVAVSWTIGGGSFPTAELLERIKGGDLYALPLWDLRAGRYEILSLTIDSPDEHLGSPDIRIQNGGDLIHLHANLGHLTGMDHIWERVLGGVNFPITVGDEFGYTFQNKP